MCEMLLRALLRDPPSCRKQNSTLKQSTTWPYATKPSERKFVNPNLRMRMGGGQELICQSCNRQNFHGANGK